MGCGHDSLYPRRPLPMHSDLLAVWEATVDAGISATGVRSLSVDAARHTLEDGNESCGSISGTTIARDAAVDRSHPGAARGCGGLPQPDAGTQAARLRDHYFSSINGLARGSDERLYFRR